MTRLDCLRGPALGLGFIILVTGHLRAQTPDRWRVLTTARSGLVAVDTTTVDRKGPRSYEAWLRFDGSPSDSARNASYRLVQVAQTLTRYGLDCANRKIAQLSTTRYDSLGTVITSSSADTAHWQLVLPESLGESFLREFCNAIEGRSRNRVWLLPAGRSERFAPDSIRIADTTELKIFAGVDTTHILVFDTTGLSQSQQRAVAAYADSLDIFNRAYGLGDHVVFPPLPSGKYKVYCVAHMPYRFFWLTVDVVPSTRRTPTQRPKSTARP
jgi:hypothetical protein